jgi:protein-arginine kinase activator protein McsA
MQAAVKKEDYERASQVRDVIQRIEDGDESVWSELDKDSSGQS